MAQGRAGTRAGAQASGTRAGGGQASTYGTACRPYKQYHNKET